MSSKVNATDVAQKEEQLRHLRPDNLSPLRRKMKKQLEDLKGVNSQGFPLPPFEHKEGSRHLHNILVSKGEN